MGLFPMNVGNGGTMSETLLWSNATPTSSFGGQTVSLSEPITNFDFIKIYYNASTTDTTEKSVIYPIDVWLTLGTDPNVGSIASKYSNAYYARRVRYISNSEVSFYTSGLINASGTNNNLVIPTKICGLK